MEILRGKTVSPQGFPHPVVGIGNFDGVHRGHQTILREVVRRAGAKNGTAAVLTFDPHPLKILSPTKDLKFLMSFDERAEFFEKEGIQLVRAIPFNREFASLEPELFAQTILKGELGAKEVLVGSGFRFGRDRTGTVNDLTRFGKQFGFSVHVIEPLEVGGRPVSSSRIRGNLHEGRVTEARELIGRPYFLEGKVIPATRRGRPMGFPTANFKPPPERVIPCNGIYAVRAFLKGGEGRTIDGVSYIGTQPTLGVTDRMVETHLFEPQPDLYGVKIRVDFYQWVRPEEVFHSREDLIKNIKEDIQKARDFLSRKK